MNKAQRTKEKLNQLSEDDWMVAMEKCKRLIDYRVKGRTKFGCHSKENLGESPFDYYFNKALDKLYEGEWEWKDQYSFSEQVCRIVGSIISENVRKYKKNNEKNFESIQKEISFEDIAYYFGVDFDEEIKVKEKEKIYEEQLNTIQEVIDGNNDMETLFLCVLDGKNKDEICSETGWERKKLYKITDQMKTKVKKYIAKQSKEIAK